MNEGEFLNLREVEAAKPKMEMYLEPALQWIREVGRYTEKSLGEHFRLDAVNARALNMLLKDEDDHKEA